MNPRAPRRAGPSALVCLLLGCLSCGGTQRDEPPADLVVWVVVDTLRADALGAYGLWSELDPVGEGGVEPTPHLDRFAREDALVFERAYTVSPWTAPSLVSMSTGLWPFEHGVVRLLEPVPAHLVAFPEVLRAHGWRTGGVTTNFVARGLEGFDQGFEQWDDSLALGHEGTTVERALDISLAQLDAMEGDGRGRYVWALWFEPHWRFVPHPGLRFGPGYGGRAPLPAQVDGSEDLAELRRRADPAQPDALGPADTALLRGLYQSEVAAIDRAFGRLRAELEARGLWERTLLVFTADHGEELLEHGWLGHTTSLREALVRVPLFVKLPGAPRPGRVAAPVSLVDLAPGLLARCGLDPAELGRPAGAPHLGSLFDDPAGPAPRERIYLHVDFAPVLGPREASTPTVHQWGVVGASSLHKWVVDHAAEGGPRGRLVDLRGDPLETRDLAGEDPFPAPARALSDRLGLVPKPLGRAHPATLVPTAGAARSQ